MNLHNLFEDDSRTPNPNYAEELAYQIFKAAPNLDTTGAADEVLDYAYDLVVNDFGKTKANALFAYDEDFDSDLVNAYLDLQMNQQAVDKRQVNEVDPRNFDSDEDYYAAKNAPAKRRSAPSDYPYSPEEDDAYFREIFRKKRLAKQKADRDADHDRLATGTNESVAEGQEVDASVVIGKLYDVIDHAEDIIKNADYDRQVQYATVLRDRAVKALNMIKQGGNSPEAALDAFAYMQSGEQGVAEGGIPNLRKYGQEVPSTEAAIDAFSNGDRVFLFPEMDNAPFEAPDIETIANYSPEQILVVPSQGVAEGADERKQNALWAQITAHEKAAKKSTDLKQQHHLKMADQLRSQLKTTDEGFDYTVKDLGNDYAGFPSNHSMKNKFLAKIKPEKQQLYKDKMNNTHDWDSLFALFKVAKARGDIVEQGVAEELAMQHQRDHKTQKYADTSNSLAKRSISQAEVPNVSKSADGHPTVRGRADSTRKTTNTRVEPTITPTSVKRLGGDRPIPSFLQKNVAEANKKKDDDLGQEIKDVSLNRAITRAKADFPTAGSGIEALAKDFMRSQEQDQTAFGQLRQAERKQDQMLSQISKIDQEQEKEIQSLDNQNSSLASRLQQLQNVNSELEKKLAAMSGRKKEKRKDKSATAPEPSLSTAPATPATGSTTEPDNITPEPSASPVIGRMAQDLTAEPSKSKAIGQIARTLSPPSSAIDQMAQQLKPRQKELPLGDPNVLDPDIKSGRRINTSKAVDAPYRDVSVKMAKKLATDPAMRNQMYNADALRNLAGQEEMPLESDSKISKTDRPEAKYSDKYQDMVARVGQKAREQEKSKPVDIKDLARRLAAIEASRKD